MASQSTTPVCGVYVIENTVNGKQYIGSSRNIPRRWADHQHRLRDGRHENAHLQRAWTKYGEAAFTFRVLCVTAVTERRSAEAAAVRACAAAVLYNQMPASPDRSAMTHSAETRAKISAGNMGRVVTTETRARIRAKHVGKVLTPEHRQKLSEAKRGWSPPPDHPFRRRVWKGRQHTPEAIEKIAASKRGKPRSAETRAKLSAALKGRPLAPAHRAKVVAATTGRRYSPEARARMGHPLTPENKAKLHEGLRRRWERWRAQREGADGLD